MNKEKELLEVELLTQERHSNNDYVNLYIFIDGVRFELVPHCRSTKETAYFYALLKKTKLFANC